MKLWNKCICLTSPTTIMVVVVLLFSTILIANVWPKEIIIEPVLEDEMWIPTKEDIAYQDSMYQIILNTQNDVDTIKVHIEYILERLEYSDGNSDSIRIVSNNKMK